MELLTAMLMRKYVDDSAGHLARAITRGSARLAPSMIECPTKAAIKFLKDQDAIVEARAVWEGMTSEPFSPERVMPNGDQHDEFRQWVNGHLYAQAVKEAADKGLGTLYLFKMGRVYEDIAVQMFQYSYGVPDNSVLPLGRYVGAAGRELLLDNGTWRGMVDCVIPWGDGVAFVEIKSTKTASIQMYMPSASHVLQLWKYTQLAAEVLPDLNVTGAFLAYLPNDIHPKDAVNVMQVMDITDDIPLVGDRDDGFALCKAAEDMALRPEIPVEPHYDGRRWPCAAGSWQCDLFGTCHSSDSMCLPMWEY
jgi:hypothetical protein